MDRKELEPFIPPRILKAKGKALDAIYAHFIDGLTVIEAAEKTGWTRQGAGVAIRKVKEAILEAGYTRHYVRKVVYTKASKPRKPGNRVIV